MTNEGKEVYVCVGRHSVTQEYVTQVLFTEFTPETAYPLYRKWHGIGDEGFKAAEADAQRMFGNLAFTGERPMKSEIQYCKASKATKERLEAQA